MEPLYGLLTTLLVVYGLADVSSNLVVVLPEKVNAVQGKKITLSCRIEAVPDLKLIQCSWERQLPSGKEIMAVFHSEYGTSIPAELANRVSFVTASAQDVSITLDVVNLADIGSYTCKVSTFPLGNAQASTYVNVLVEPKVYVSAGPAALLEGESESLVATCIAERGRPAAEVSWETELRGREETQSHDEPDGTASVHVRYMWEPHSSAQGKTLTCVVRHPALQTEFRIPYTLNIQFAPMVFIKGGEKNWYAGQTDVTIICGAQANPPVREYTWVRLDGQMPENVNIVTNRFAFTRPLELNDSGVYRCEATNDVGVRSHDLSIWVQEPPSTTAAPVPTTSDGPPHVPGTARSPFTSPTLAPVRDATLGAVVGGAVGGGVLLILALVAAGFCFMRKRLTFRGDYYTKQYLGPSDMQKESQLDVLQPHELQEVYGDKADNGSQELKPKLSGDVIYPDYTGGDRGGDDWADREGDYYPDRCRGQNTHHPCGPPVVNNGSPYLPEDCYNNCADGDYVSHTDGSVISRREWCRTCLEMIAKHSNSNLGLTGDFSKKWIEHVHSFSTKDVSLLSSKIVFWMFL
ncbi:nectin-3-like protein isoform X2 [Phyllopteryx taeniolatus]|uniref:nectin-3-like protein isoform X2 n=1 Tax=Phyllopteryx taeniolatus TaxID=161469 RepID=UPI002AD4FCA9|nr:nectin-3-like protein isoform X2 [Phyllopteryx taeniolatus]